MRLPEALQQRPFAEWNYLVKGIVEVWELARSLGFEETLEEHLSRDEEGRLAELLGCLGGELLHLNASNHQTGNSSEQDALMGGYRLFVANALATFFPPGGGRAWEAAALCKRRRSSQRRRARAPRRPIGGYIPPQAGFLSRPVPRLKKNGNEDFAQHDQSHHGDQHAPQRPTSPPHTNLLAQCILFPQPRDKSGAVRNFSASREEILGLGAREYGEAVEGNPIMLTSRPRATRTNTERGDLLGASA